MDFNSIAKEAFTIILPSLTTIKDGGLKSIGSDIWELIKKPFKLDHDKRLLDKFEKDPDNLKLQGGLELRLAQLLEENPGIAKELEKCIGNFKGKEGISNISIQKDITHNNSPNHSGIGDIHSTYNINNNYFSNKNDEKNPKKS